jgi:hypothetical protein
MEEHIKRLIAQNTRRDFLKKTAMGLGSLALSGLVNPLSSFANKKTSFLDGNQGVLGNGHFPAKAKRVIYLFQSGGPSQLETFDYKPSLKKWHGLEIPDSVRGTQRNSGMVANQSTFPLVKSIYDFE